jgi:hypothetical protein
LVFKPQELDGLFDREFPPFHILFIIKGPSLYRDVPLLKEIMEIFPVDTVMAAGESERFQIAAFYPFQDGAFAYLAVIGNIT